MNKKIYEIYKNDEIYPKILKNINGAPKKLYAIGNLNLLKKEAVAVVGSRNSSEYGRNITKKITKNLVENEIVIISGLAIGIDTVAHETCIKNGGETIAIIGSGFKHIYPKENEELFYKILNNNGLIISEYSINEPVQMKNFPRRNRIISGLSLGVLVIEAAYRSGTSITANFAKMQGRKLFCIPNAIGNKNSCGTINLVKNGAILVSDANDILKVLGKDVKEIKKENKNKQLKLLDEKSQLIYDCISKNMEIDSEVIAIKTKLDIASVNQILTLLELDELVESTKTNKFVIVKE